jgi:hypothetical protein
LRKAGAVQATELRRIRATVIGGSNTLMGAAYIADVPKCARALGIDLEIVANLAIGNTSSLTGLMRLKSGAQIQNSDLLIIEYALNDVSLYGDDRAAIECWVKSYEGMIRHALTANPGIRILSFVLYNQQGSHRSTLPLLPAAIGYLSDWYGLTKVDAHREFAQRFGAGYPEVAGLYADPAHYSRPVFTRLLAELLAAGIRKAADPRRQRLPCRRQSIPPITSMRASSPAPRPGRASRRRRSGTQSTQSRRSSLPAPMLSYSSRADDCWRRSLPARPMCRGSMWSWTAGPMNARRSGRASGTASSASCWRR